MRRRPAPVPQMSVDSTQGTSPTAPGIQAVGTNGFAIASMILGIIGVALLGLIFGLVALSRIAKTGEAGRGMAITGIVTSIAWMLLSAVLVVLIASS
ncbi:MAG: DUF4190 domain-containing protein [Actinobacteria bacterium]|nr:DUF4190 domain-containing protein [Actinomycetota bacterium]